jgi:hypothetical protein
MNICSLDAEAKPYWASRSPAMSEAPPALDARLKGHRAATGQKSTPKRLTNRAAGLS